MPIDPITERADSFGLLLNVFGALIALAGVSLGIYAIIRSNAAAAINADGTQSVSQAFYGISYAVAGIIAVGGVALGALLGWAGFMLRTVVAIHDRISVAAPNAVHVPAPAAPFEVPPMPLPSFVRPDGSGF
jgi:hypothetical protein